MQKFFFFQTHQRLYSFLMILLLWIGFSAGCSNMSPVATEVAPAEDASDVSIGSRVTVKFSRPMDADTINSDSFSLNRSSEPVAGEVSYDADTRTATFIPEAGLAYGTTYTARLSTQAADMVGIELAEDRIWHFTTEEILLDIELPSILTVTPSDHATGIDVTTTMTARFSKAMSAVTIHEESFLLTDQTGTPVSGTVTYDGSTYTATFTPADGLIHNSLYTAKVTIVATDLSGNPMTAEKSWSFATSAPPDITPPAPVVVSAVTVDNARVEINWSDPADMDFDHVEVAWSPDGTAGQIVAAATETYPVTGLVNDTEYTFTLVSVDRTSNRSVPVSFTARPTLSGESVHQCLYSGTDLDAVRSGLNGHYILMADIDLSAQYGAGWTPIGTDSDHPFIGTLDGNDHVITGLFIDSGAHYSGLFGYTGIGSVVKNLGVVDCDVRSTGWYTGGLIGCNTRGTIINCHSSGAVVSNGATIFTGGLIGLNSQGPLTLCYSTATVNGSSRVGGLAGHNNNAGVNQCYSTGNVLGSGFDIGGLFGYSNSTTISNCFATGSVTGGTNVGGFSGNLDYIALSNCYSAGSVSGSSNTGGLVGDFGDSSFTYCYYDQDTSGQSDTGKGEPRTTEQMQLIDTSVSIYENWDFSGTWEYENGYPFLKLNPLP